MHPVEATPAACHLWPRMFGRNYVMMMTQNSSALRLRYQRASSWSTMAIGHRKHLNHQNPPVFVLRGDEKRALWTQLLKWLRR